jgi:hypothetical protein
MSVSVESEPVDPAMVHVRTLSAMRSARGHLKVYALKLVVFGVAAFLVLRLTPSLARALTSLERISWQWLVIVLALEVLSELGYVVAWRHTVDPERVLDRTACGLRLQEATRSIPEISWFPEPAHDDRKLKGCAQKVQRGCSEGPKRPGNPARNLSY